MQGEALTRKALEALDNHLRYWEWIGTDDHQIMITGFLRTYDPTLFDQLVSGDQDFFRVTSEVADYWTKEEARAWNYGATCLLEQHTHDLVTQASESMPPVPFMADMLPAPYGVVMMPGMQELFNYYGDPEMLEYGEGIGRLPVRCLAWAYNDTGIAHPTLGVGPGVDIWLYTLMEDIKIPDQTTEQYSVNDWVQRHQGGLVICDRIPWREGAKWRVAASDEELRIREQRRGARHKIRDYMEEGGEVPDELWGDSQNYLADDDAVLTDDHVAKMRRFMLALWTFMSDKILVQSKQNLPRPWAKRLIRSGRTPDAPEDGVLRVIKLRSVEYLGDRDQDGDGPADAEGREWSHRWYVRGHWRHLASGRVIWVRPHLKGPEDKPVVLKNNIITVNR